MAKYLLLKHYRGDHAIAAQELPPMDQWQPDEVEAHIASMHRVNDELKQSG